MSIAGVGTISTPLGLTTDNNLGCKVRRKAFHKYEAFGFHTSNAHDGQYNSSMSSRNIQSVPAKRINSEPCRESSRTSLRSPSYDDEIEILDEDVEPINLRAGRP